MEKTISDLGKKKISLLINTLGEGEGIMISLLC